MRLEHHLVGGYVRYISPHIIIIIIIIQIRYYLKNRVSIWGVQMTPKGIAGYHYILI